MPLKRTQISQRTKQKQMITHHWYFEDQFSETTGDILKSQM